MAFRHAPRLITAEDPEFRALFGEELSRSISAIYSSPEQQAAAREEAERLERDKRQQEAQLLKEICDGADNKVYGKAGQDIASRFPAGPDGKRDYYMQVGLREALARAGLLKRGRKR
jgi:hypothetical protein